MVSLLFFPRRNGVSQRKFPLPPTTFGETSCRYKKTLAELPFFLRNNTLLSERLWQSSMLLLDAGREPGIPANCPLHFATLHLIHHNFHHGIASTDARVSAWRPIERLGAITIGFVLSPIQQSNNRKLAKSSLDQHDTP